MSLALEYRRCATRYFAARTVSATRPGARLALTARAAKYRPAQR